jgi:cytochrome oxidase Cu insertion factor (SCO1/SenC/PrrC family)
VPRDPVPHAVALALAVLVSHGCARSSLPTYGTLGEFSLVDEDEHAFGSAQLRGRVWITAFLFTSCPMECPLLAQRMGWLQERLAGRSPALQMLAVSINPAQDTPAVLRGYGERFHRDPRRWTFVTGATGPLYRVVTDGYDRADPSARQGAFAALHGERFALIDGDGRIRGYYRKDDADVARMLAAAEQLLPR